MAVVPTKVFHCVFVTSLHADIVLGFSGPKRYDYSPERNTWVYARDQVSIGSLLEDELADAFGKPVHLRLEPEAAPPQPPQTPDSPQTSETPAAAS